MSEANRYGRIVTPQMVENAMKATLEDWMPDYLGELARIEGYGPNVVEEPRAIVTASEFAKHPEDQLPVILVLNAGLSGPPTRRANGTYEASWLVGVAPIVGDMDMELSRRLAATYTAACRTAVLQHKRLKSTLYTDGFATFLTWKDEKYSDIPFGEARTLASGHVFFAVGVEGVVTEQAGPRVPSPSPEVDPGPWPDVEHVEIEVESVPLTGSFA